MKEIRGMRTLEQQELAQVDGGWIGVAIRVVVAVAKNPTVQKAVVEGFKWATMGAGAYGLADGAFGLSKK